MRPRRLRNSADDAGDESAFLRLGLLVDQRGVVGAVAHPLPFEPIPLLDNARVMAAHIRIERHCAAHAVALHDFHHAPDAHAHAVIAPGIVQHVGHEARRDMRQRGGRAVEEKMLDVRNHPYGHARALGPAQRLAIHNRGIRETVVFLRVSRAQLGHRFPLWDQARLGDAAETRDEFRYAKVSSSVTTSAYFAFKSKRLCSCADRDRSPTASRTTMGRNPFWQASTAEARTQPLVVQPVMISVSTVRTLSREIRSVPKKQEAYFFTSSESPGRKSRRGSICTPSVPARRLAEPFCFMPKIPASFRFSSS